MKVTVTEAALVRWSKRQVDVVVVIVLVVVVVVVLDVAIGFSVDQSVDMVQRYDRNRDGKLNYEEFVCFYAKVKAK